MSVTILVGAQWGDEGKGKVIDVLAAKADVVVRYQGGNNAGHTVEVGDQQYKLHLIPSGILHRGTINILGNGVVVDPVALADEIAKLRARGVSIDGLAAPKRGDGGNLFISESCHLVLPYHPLLDEYREGAKGARKIGTTKRGIGPAYADKVARVNLRMMDLMNPRRFSEKLRDCLRRNNDVLRAWGAPTVSYTDARRSLLTAARVLRPHVTDTITLLNRAVAQGKEILFEGAQGTLLDIDHGTYPYVTSSNCTAGGACTGSGLSPNKIDRVIGVTKAYTTRVGEGPFPTELHDSLGEQIRQTGHEFGTTTGRARRCGWWDAVAVRYAVLINGLDALAVTKLDVLDKLPKVRACVGYKLGSKTIETMPHDAEVLARCRPIYQEFDGWQSSTQLSRRFDELPKRARIYLNAMSKLAGAPIQIVSVGARQDQTIIL